MKIREEWIEAVEYRTSRRVYVDKILEVKNLYKLEKLIEEINRESNLNFQLVEDCSALFRGFSASYGMIKGLNSCIALVGSKKIEDVKNKVGYYGEMLVLEATSMNLGTCWIGGTYNKKECRKYINIKNDEELICVIAVGNVLENKSIREKVISKVNSNKKTFDQILLEKDTKSIPNWVKNGIDFVIKSPSALNKQLYKYSFKKEIVEASTTAENHGFEEVDLGISMLHFELGASKKNHIGKWYYVNGEKKYI